MTYDVIVIGSGQAGVPLATRLATTERRRVLLVERAALGGTCINYGCTPTKTMVASARAAHVARTASRFGIDAGEVNVDLPAVVARKDAMVNRWRDRVRKRLDDAGDRLTVVEGHARFVGPRTVEIGSTRHRGDTIIVNTGARPAVPPIPGLEAVPWLDNTRLMALTTMPEHLVVLGGGYIGCELGQLYRRLGARVTIVDHNAHLLGREDEEISSALEEVFRRDGVTLELGTSAKRVRSDGSTIVVTTDRGELRGSHLLVALGRRPNTDDLGCEVAGIARDTRGAIVVNDGYETNVAGVYAVGDVTGGPQFTHTSWDDHRILFDRLTGRGTRGRSDRLVPFCVFTDPQVGGVGRTERELRDASVPYEVAKMPFGDIARAIEVDEREGTMKLLIDPKTEEVLGCRIVGDSAGELIHVFVALMQARASVSALVLAEAVHPTFAEGLQSLVMSLPRFALE